MPNQQREDSFTGRFRTTLDRWEAYQALCASEGTTPSEDLRSYMDGRLSEAGFEVESAPVVPVRTAARAL